MAWHVFRGPRLDEKGLLIIWALFARFVYFLYRVPGTWFLKTLIHPIHFIFPM